MQALILAGGEGTRLRPLTYTTPKPILPLAGRPHIAYVIDWLQLHGVDEVVISSGHMAESVRSALEGGEFPRLRFAEEPDPRGTAGAIRFAEELLEERFLVLNGDVLCDLDLTALIAEHERAGARATVALYPVHDPSAYGLVRRREDGEITEFLEKPQPDQIDTDEVNAGAYLLERSVVGEIPPEENVSIERETFPALVGRGLFGCRLDGYWIDIGTPERYLQASWDILEGRMHSVAQERLDERGVGLETGVQVAGGATIEPPALIGPGTRVDRGARVGPRAVLGSECVIGEGAAVEGSVLLDRCRLGEGASVRDSVLADRVEVASGAAPEPGSVIGEGKLIGAAA